MSERELVELIQDELNCLPGHEAKTIKEAAKALRQLGTLVHLVGRDWNFYADIPRELAKELVDRATY